MLRQSRRTCRLTLLPSVWSSSCEFDPFLKITNFQLPNLCQPSIKVDRYRWYHEHRIRQSCYIPSSGRSVEGKCGGCAILPMITYGGTILPMITFGSTILPMIDLEVLYFPWSHFTYAFLFVDIVVLEVKTKPSTAKCHTPYHLISRSILLSTNNKMYLILGFRRLYALSR